MDKELNDYFMEHLNLRKVTLPIDVNDPECNKICNDEIRVHIH